MTLTGLTNLDFAVLKNYVFVTSLPKGVTCYKPPKGEKFYYSLCFVTRYRFVSFTMLTLCCEATPLGGTQGMIGMTSQPYIDTRVDLTKLSCLALVPHLFRTCFALAWHLLGTCFALVSHLLRTKS